MIAEAATCTETHEAYWNQAGWRRNEWPPHSDHLRTGFVCADSLASGKVLHAGDSVKTYPMRGALGDASFSMFAGVVCIADIDA